MIVHIVLFKWHPDTSAENITLAMSTLKGMKGKVPEIIDISCGNNFSELSQGFQNVLVVQFKDKAALDAYAKNAYHQEIIKTLIK
ncbi:MAG: Dabb family protein, partial [Okeania sp. SIO2D1]|nr:Dabb family protein [Okeania sp. SIO2D1]